MLFMMGALDHPVLARPLEGLETEVNHMGGQPYLCDQDPAKTLDINVGVSFLGW